MSKLEDLRPNAAVRGILPDAIVSVVNTQWFGSEALELTYKAPTGRVANELLYRHDESRIEVVEQGRPWSFDGDGGLFRLVSEAHRIRLAHLFDPLLAVHTSLIDPLLPVDNWPSVDITLQRLTREYARLLDIRVSGEAPDYLLWHAVDVPAICSRRYRARLRASLLGNSRNRRPKIRLRGMATAIERHFVFRNA